MSEKSTLIRRKVFLALVSGGLLGFSFPPVPTGIFAIIAFVPFFIMMESMESYGEGIRFSFIMFFAFNVITLYWAGGFTHGKDIYLMLAGVMLLLAHPCFFCVPILAWMFVRKHFSRNVSLMVFPFLWTSFEYVHSLSELSFPWLTLGNTQTNNLAAIQFASFTGVYGVSFWILVLNVIAYKLYMVIAKPDGNKVFLRIVVPSLGFLVFYFLPHLYGNGIMSSAEVTSGQKVQIAIIQPNIDPFEKWQENAEKQILTIKELTRNSSGDHPDLVIWPETAIPFYLLHPNNRSVFESIKHFVDSLNINLLSGVPDMVVYQQGEDIPRSSKVLASGQHYDTFNSSVLLQPHEETVRKYAKIVLVPFAERVPFSEGLSFLNAMQWNFGLGGWAHGNDTTVFECKLNDGQHVRFSNVICYESVYPGLVASFVRKGAQFLTIMTNDSWWGNTSGAYQHKQFAVLRAIENHRWIVQCANGGISCIIDPFGHILRQTEMYEKSVLVHSIVPLTESTFYSLHGDWFSELCFIISLFILSAGAGKKMYERMTRGSV